MARESAASVVRRQVIYAGRVQGVGFRFTARELSRGFAVSGFVRNLPDGTVELEAEGAADEVSRFLRAIVEHFGGNIHSHEVNDRAVSGDSGRFEIVY